MPAIAKIIPPPSCPLGPLTAGATDKGVCCVSLAPLGSQSDRLAELSARFGQPCEVRDHPHLDALRSNLDAYFAGDPDPFTVPIDAPGTAWESRVWDALRSIPHGETRSYGSIARQLDNPGGSRAVGLANGRNRIAILIPCHRVIASDGSLHGYASGLKAKKWLLDHEQAASPPSGSLFGSCEETAP